MWIINQIYQTKAPCNLMPCILKFDLLEQILIRAHSLSQGWIVTVAKFVCQRAKYIVLTLSADLRFSDNCILYWASSLFFIELFLKEIKRVWLF